LFGVAAKHTPLKLVLAFDFDVRHHYSQRLLRNCTITLVRLL
jgi:hypothetical protein